MPVDLYFACVDLTPPGGKLFFWDIKGGRCHQMVKNYVVLLTPAKSSEMTEVIIIKSLSAIGFAMVFSGR